MSRFSHYCKLTLLIVFLSLNTNSHADTQVEVASKPDKKWNLYSTRTLQDFPELANSAADSNQDQYGGNSELKQRATGYFYTKRIKKRWWLIDPDGHLYVHKGVNSVNQVRSDGAKAALVKKFGDNQRWADATTLLIREHGFTGLGAWSDSAKLRKVERPLVYSKIWNFMSTYGSKRGGTYQRPGNTGYPNDSIFVFDPEFETHCDEYAKQLAETKNDPWLLGHFSDNELPLWRSSLRNYLELPDTDHGHIAAKKWLRRKHGKKANSENITDQDEKDFLGFIATRYFRIVSKAIKKHDPNHLYLGSRFNGRVTKYPEVYKAAGKYLDVVSVNYYHAWTPDPKRLSMWANESRRPIIITEWYAKGMDSGLANHSGAGWLVKTQEDRGKFYQNFTLGLMESKVCIGWDWFKYIDNDPEAKRVDPSNTDSNKGIVSNRYDPYEPLLASMREINDRSYKIIDQFDDK